MTNKRFSIRGLTPEHSAYLRKRHLQTIQVRLLQILIALLFFAGWEMASRFEWINPLLFSKPSDMIRLMVQFWLHQNLFGHILATVAETLAGFLLGTILGTAVATLIWASPFLSRVLDPYLVILNGMPKVALGPLFIVAFGGGFFAIVSMAIAISVIITIIVVHTSFKEVDPNFIKLARTFGANQRQIFQKIVFPASFPTIISTLKVNVGLAWVGVIVGEFLVSKQGLGYLIIYGFQVFNFTLVMLSLLIVAILATVMYQAVQWLEDEVMRRRGHS